MLRAYHLYHGEIMYTILAFVLACSNSEMTQFSSSGATNVDPNSFAASNSNNVNNSNGSNQQDTQDPQDTGNENVSDTGNAETGDTGKEDSGNDRQAKK